jgi:threonine/homoserine/homoserine lactone efflux protein
MEMVWQYGGGMLIGLVAAVSPGPDTVLVLRSVVAGGARAGARAALGIGSALVIHALATVLLVVLIRDQAGSLALHLLQLAGAAYLAYLGVLLLRSALKRRAGPVEWDQADRATQGYFAQGFLTNLTNPKAIVFFGSIVSQFITAQDVGSGTAVLLGIVTAVPAWFLVLSYGSARYLGGLADRSRRVIDIVAGVLFLAVAGWGVVTALVR